MDFFGRAKSSSARGRAPSQQPRVVTTTTVKRVQPPAQRPKPASAPTRHNALPVAVQQRLAREREQAEHQRAEKTRAEAAADSDTNRASKRADVATRAPANKRVRRSPSPVAPSTAAPHSGASTFSYHVPRDIVFENSYNPLAPDVAASGLSHALSSAELVRQSPATYLPFFEGLDGDELVVVLEYPAPDAHEEFLLLVPKDSDEYDPISDLLRAVSAMVAHYVPPDMQPQFGTLESLEMASNAGMPLSEARARVSLSESPSRDATPQSVHGSESSALSTDDTESILRSFTKARNRRHGPLFVRTVHRFNELLRSFTDRGIVQAQLTELGRTHGVPEGVWRTIQEQVYARVAAPHVEKLKHYEAFSDFVYVMGRQTDSAMARCSRRF